MPRKLVARDHREAYDLWATHFADPALMANRDAESNRRNAQRLASKLPLHLTSNVLDVGPGDGAFLRVIASRVRRCCGVDPSANAVAKLTTLFRDVPNVEFVVGAAEAIPFEDGEFDIVVINSVLQILPSAEAVERALAELVRVVTPGGFAFVGDLPFRSELSRGLIVHMARKFREYGARGFLRNILDVYVRPFVRHEPVVVHPAASLHFPEPDFAAMCRRLGADVECRLHEELLRPSFTRNDYLLRLAPR